MRWLAVVCVFVVATATHGEPRRDGLTIEGATMGTTYRVRVADVGAEIGGPRLEQVVGDVLDRVDTLMSTYRQDSELARFNRYRGMDWFSVSPETAEVAGAARTLALQSDGAFDPTVGPLVRLWGFGPKLTSDPNLVPADDRVAATREAVGVRSLSVQASPPALRKARPQLELDLSGIAKGYAIDAIADQLIENGAVNFLIEIGGEVRAKGKSPRGDAWIVAIEDPSRRAGDPTLRIELADAAIATSGPYRNFLVRDSTRHSHLIDPRSGFPVASPLISVSVVAPTTMQADGWATALLVAGPDQGWTMATDLALAALFVTAGEDSPRARPTPAFNQFFAGSESRKEANP